MLKHLDPAYRVPLQFAYITGWRIHSEVLTLQWRQVDLDAGVVRLEPGTTKNRDGREFYSGPLPELMKLLKGQATIRDRLKKSGRIVPWVFHVEGHPLTFPYVAWRAACRRRACRDVFPTTSGAPPSATWCGRA